MAFQRSTASIAAALFVALTAFGGSLTSAAAQSDEGQIAFNNACRTCHTVEEGDNRLGPHLHGVIGRKAGSVEGYAYSDSMKQSGIVWDKENLDKFIANPEAVVPGNKMKPYTGMTDAKEREKIISYLASAGK